MKEPDDGRPDVSALTAEERALSGTAADRLVFAEAGPRTGAGTAVLVNDVVIGCAELSSRVALREVSGKVGVPAPDDTGGSAEGPPAGGSSRCTVGEDGDGSSWVAWGIASSGAPVGPTPASRARTFEIAAPAAVADWRASCPVTGNVADAVGIAEAGRATGAVAPADSGVAFVLTARRETEGVGAPVDGGAAGGREEVCVFGGGVVEGVGVGEGAGAVGPTGTDAGVGEVEGVGVGGGAVGGGEEVCVFGGGVVEGKGVGEDADAVVPIGLDADEAEPEPARVDVVPAASASAR